MATEKNPYDPTDDTSSTDAGASSDLDEAGKPKALGSSDSSSEDGAGKNFSSSAAPAYSPAATKSGSFQNIQNYLDANAGFNGGNGLAGKTYDTLKDQSQQQQNSIGNAATQTAQDQSKAGSQYDPNAVGNFISQATADPYAASQDANQVAQYQNYLNASYNGPNGLNNYNDLASKAQNFNQTTGLVNSEPGRQALLQKLYNNGSYSQGQQSLDNLLISANPDQLQHLQGAQSFGNDLMGNLNSAQDAAQSLGNTYSKWAGQAKTDSLAGIDKADSDLDSKLSALAGTNTTAKNTQYDNTMSNLQSGNLTDADRQLLGLPANGIQYLYGADPTKYLSKVNDPTKMDVATGDDVNRFAGLAKLAGGYDPNAGLMASQYGKAGGYDPSQAVKYDTSGLMGDIESGKKSFNDQLSNLLNGSYTGTTQNGSLTSKFNFAPGSSIEDAMKTISGDMDQYRSQEGIGGPTQSNGYNPDAPMQQYNAANTLYNLLGKLSGTRGGGLDYTSGVKPTLGLGPVTPSQTQYYGNPNSALDSELVSPDTTNPTGLKVRR